MIRLYAWIGGAALIVALLGGAYIAIYSKGKTAGDLMCRSELGPVIKARDVQIENYKTEADARARAVASVQAAKAAAEESLRRQMEDQRNDYSQRLAALEAGNAGARRELVRLRDALATARVSTDSLLRPVASGTGPAPDGAASVAERVIRECAERRVEVGGLAARLAEQVIGLQAYARAAHQACR
jgi:chromosome segregation ATPase